MKRDPARQRGFSAITAVVLIVLFALIGAYMATLSGTQSLSTTTSLGSMQAWFAAHSGVEWAIFRVLNDNNCAAVNGTTLTLTESGAEGYAVDLTCTATSYTEGPNTYNVYALTSSASRGTTGQVGYVSRVITTRVTNAP
jgi:Tfp pilus assembly protein PilX